MSNKSNYSVWEIIDLMVDYYTSLDYICDEKDELMVTEMKNEIDIMLSETNVRQLYHELTKYYNVPTPAGNIDPIYAVANLWQIAYDARCNNRNIYVFRFYVPFDGIPGVKEYVWHCEATHEWFKEPVDNSLPIKEAFHKK